MAEPHPRSLGICILTWPLVMLLVQKLHFENHGSGLEERACSGGWRREAAEGKPVRLTILRTLRGTRRLRLRSPQCVPNPGGPSHLSRWSLAAQLIRMPLSPVPLLPGAAPRSLLVRGSHGPAPARVLRRRRWKLPLPHRKQRLSLGWGAAGPLAGAWGHPLGLFAE